MPVKLTNGNDCADMKRKWTTIRIDDDIERQLSIRGKFGQSYNDVIGEILLELKSLKEKKR